MPSEDSLALHPHRYTLLQARKKGDAARIDEHKAFAARIDVTPEQIRSVCVLTEPLDDGVLDGSVALFVGGAGHYSVLDDEPSIHSFIDFLAETAESGFPVFASCFGFQALVVGLGGSVLSDEDHAEVGSYELSLTPEAADDPLFGEMPESFVAQLGHKDRASRLPAGVVNLASSERAPLQAFRVPGRPVYATQFHPELTWQDNRSRFLRYMDEYGRLFGREEAQSRLDSHRPGPEANALLPRFVAAFTGEMP